MATDVEPMRIARARARTSRWAVLTLVVAGQLVAAGLAALTWDGDGRLVPAMWFLAAVVAACLVGGLAAGILATTLSGLLLIFFFTRPRYSFLLENQSELSGIVAYVVAALALSLLIDWLQVARARAEAIAAERNRSLALLDGVLANAPVGIASLDRQLRIVRINQAMADMNEVPVEAHLGRRITEVLGPHIAPLEERVRMVLESGRAQLDIEVSATRRSGKPIHAIAGFYPVRDPSGRVVGVGAVVNDVTGRMAAEAGRSLLYERVASIQAVTSTLAEAITVDDVAAVVLTQGGDAVGASSASLALLAEGFIRLSATRHLPEEVTARWSRFGLDAQLPHADVIRTGVPVLVADATELTERYPDFLAVAGDALGSSFSCLPLVAEGRVIGSVAFGFPEPQILDTGQRTFLAAVAGLCAAALERARFYEAERREKARTQAAGERLAFIAEASVVLSSSLDWETTLRRVAELAVPRVADQCGVFSLDERGVLQPLVIAHVDPARGRLVRSLFERYPVDTSADAGLGAIVRRGGSERWFATDELLARIATDDEHLELLESLGRQSGITVPIVAQRAVVGAIDLASDEGRPVDDDDVTMAQELGRRAAQAIVNARLFNERAHIAQVLQASLLPRSSHTIPGAEVATRFLAGGEGAGVGGDFYDAFPLGHRDDPQPEWALVIGDVRGRGVEAAALTGTARNTLRSIGLLEHSPARMLGHLNEVLLRSTAGSDAAEDGEPRFCTAAVACISPQDDGAEVRLAVAGHPPPLLLRADGTTTPVGQPGTLLGVFPDADASDVELHLDPGDALVLYTDGVTERHAGDRFFDEEGLAAVLSRCAGFTAATLAERIETAARAFVEDELRDDLAIVVLRIPERTRATSTSATADLPALVSSPRRARQFVATALEALGALPLRETAELLTSEIVTNAVVHGGSGIRVNVEAEGAMLRISVCDANSSIPQLRRPVGTDEHGRGLLLVDTLAARWGVEPNGNGKCVWFELPRGEGNLPPSSSPHGGRL